jgi:thiamine biosynthesis lipoprotein
MPSPRSRACSRATCCNEARSRCIVIDGVRHGHILYPRSGWPTRRLAAVSAVADQCLLAGSVATIAMLKEEEGPAWLAALGLPHLWVGVDGDSGGPALGP